MTDKPTKKTQETKKEMTLVKTIERRYCTNELEPHDYFIEIFYHWTAIRCDYIWEIAYSNDREKWGIKHYRKVADSDSECYKTPQECIPDIQEKILSVFGEDVSISISEEPLVFKNGPSKQKEVLFNKDSDHKFDTYWYRDPNAFFITIDYGLGANAYFWDICYSENKKRWGGKYNFRVARSWNKTYKTPHECIPDIEWNVLILSWGKENLKISLP